MDASDPIVMLAPAAYVTIKHAAMITGYSQIAIRRKIEDGKWLEGREWVKAPDGRVLISMRGYERWAEQDRASRSASGRSA